jgi:putative ABC transport system ATP-binding protein
MAKKELSRMRAGKIGFVFQDFNLIPIFSALENVELPMMTTGVPRAERKQKALGLLETVGLSARGQHRPDELSAGEQQRVAIARALANGPAIILADEPTGNLDTENGLRIMNLLGQLNSGLGTTIVMVTHDDRMARLAKRRLHLKDGQIVGAS